MMWFYIAVLLYVLGCIMVWGEGELYWDKVALLNIIFWPIWTIIALGMEIYFLFKGNNY